LKRGEIWTIAGGADYAGKPRPAIVVQSNKFDATKSIVVCPLTRTAVDGEPARFALEPSQANGLMIRSFVMIDKITSLPKAKVGRRIGQLVSRDLTLLDQHFAVFLGLAD
jgi:mRNA interferase MazF